MSAIARWEYKFVDKPSTTAEFEKLLIDHGVQGWEFASIAEFDSPNPGGPRVLGTPRVVFKRSTRSGGTISGDGRGGAGGGIPASGSAPAPMSFSPNGLPLVASPAKPELRKLQIQYGDAETIAGHITQLLHQSSTIRLAVDRQSNGLILYGTAADFELVEKLVKLVDVKPAMPPKP